METKIEYSAYLSILQIKKEAEPPLTLPLSFANLLLRVLG
jgi:hypothetical protein